MAKLRSKPPVDACFGSRVLFARFQVRKSVLLKNREANRKHASRFNNHTLSVDFPDRQLSAAANTNEHG